MMATTSLRPPIPASPWFLTRPQPDARLRLFCFPFAGGSAASYLPWASQLGPEIEVCAIQLPGRGARFGEPLATDFDRLIADLAEAITRYDDLPCAFFGHSMGGLIAFELCHHLRAMGRTLPRHLFLSACAPPRHRAARPRYHLLSDGDLAATLRDFAGTPPQILDDPELMEICLPIIRADFALLAGYSPGNRPPLPIPCSILAGREDAHVPITYLSDWAAETTGGCDIHKFGGDHFFLMSSADELLGLIRMACGHYRECVYALGSGPCRLSAAGQPSSANSVSNRGIRAAIALRMLS